MSFVTHGVLQSNAIQFSAARWLKESRVCWHIAQKVSPWAPSMSKSLCTLPQQKADTRQKAHTSRVKTFELRAEETQALRKRAEKASNVLLEAEKAQDPKNSKEYQKWRNITATLFYDSFVDAYRKQTHDEAQQRFQNLQNLLYTQPAAILSGLPTGWNSSTDHLPIPQSINNSKNREKMHDIEESKSAATGKSSAVGSGKGSRVSETISRAVAGIFNDSTKYTVQPYAAYAHMRGHFLTPEVHDIFPAPNLGDSINARPDLVAAQRPHVDMATTTFLPTLPVKEALLCLQTGSVMVPTRFVPIQPVMDALEAKEKTGGPAKSLVSLLQQNLFFWKGDLDKKWVETGPLVVRFEEKNNAYPLILETASPLRRAGASAEAETARQLLGAAIDKTDEEHGFNVFLKEGQMLIWDNLKWLHGRANHMSYIEKGEGVETDFSSDAATTLADVNAGKQRFFQLSSYKDDVRRTVVGLEDVNANKPNTIPTNVKMPYLQNAVEY